MHASRKQLLEWAERIGGPGGESVRSQVGPGRRLSGRVPPPVYGSPGGGPGLSLLMAAVGVTLDASEPEPGRWVLRFEGWRPASKNRRVKGRRGWIRSKRFDGDVVSLAVGRVPAAAGFRTVRVAVVTPGVLPDPQNLVESLADALVRTGLIVDDSAEWSRVETPVIRRGPLVATVVELCDGMFLRAEA